MRSAEAPDDDARAENDNSQDRRPRRQQCAPCHRHRDGEQCRFGGSAIESCHAAQTANLDVTIPDLLSDRRGRHPGPQ